MRRALLSTEGRQIRIGEASKWNVRSFGELKFDKIIQADSGTAVARIPASAGEPDRYTYLRRVKGSWKVEAGRALALTGVLQKLKLELEKLSSLTDEQQILLRNLRLTLASDADLTKWFRENQPNLDELLGTFQELKVDHICARDSENSSVTEKLKRLGVTCISRDGVRTQFIIGGMVDNEVGFMFVPESAAPPPITDSEFIWVEPLS